MLFIVIKFGKFGRTCFFHYLCSQHKYINIRYNMKKIFSLFTPLMVTLAVSMIVFSSCAKEDNGSPVAPVNICWDTNFVENVVAWCDGDGTVVHENNCKDGITVTFDGPGKYCGFYTGDIYFYKAGAQLTFTSSVGKISHIEIKAVTHTNDKVFPAGWTWVKGEKIDSMYVNVTLTWDGTPSSSVVMDSSDTRIDILDISQIIFTISD